MGNPSRNTVRTAAVFGALAAFLPASAYQEDRTTTRDTQTVVAVWTSGQVSVDGSIDDPSWKEAALLRDLTQTEPGEGTPVSERTEVRVLYTPEHLLFAVRCWDTSPSEIVATEMRRDVLLRDNDCIEIYLDTFHDHQTAYFFATNPLGAQRDGLLTADVDDGMQNWDWNGVWECAARVDSGGWTAEIAIPFKTLRFREGDSASWGLNVARVIPRKREEAYWAPVLREYGFLGKYRIAAYGHLEGMRDLQHPSRFFLKPYLLTGARRSAENGPRTERVLEPGFDGKILLTPSFTIDLSLNTDFAQVEADQEQVNLTRYELFFPEKREFFLEGASLFRFGERSWSPFFPPSHLYFSRRIGLSEDNEIVPLLGGARLTGKTGSTNVGFLTMVSGRTSYTNDDEEDISIPRTIFTALRIRQDILDNSFLGVMGLNQSSLDGSGYNRAVGLDANVYLSPHTQVGGFIAKTSSPDLRGKDLAGYLDFLVLTDFLFGFVSHAGVGENFDPAMGFFPRTGVRTTRFNGGIGPRPEFLNIRQVFLFNDMTWISDEAWKPVTRQYNAGLFSMFQDGSNLTALWQQSLERLDEEFEVHDGVNIPPGDYGYGAFLAEYNTDNSRRISGKLTTTLGGFYDGTIRSLGAGTEMRLGGRISMELLYTHNHVSVQAGSFTTSLLSARVQYTYSPVMFVKVFVQWNSDDQTILTNVLFNFIHTPGSDLYIVYNEELGTGGRGLTARNRAILLKLTYLLNV